MGYRKIPRIYTLEFSGEILNGLVVRAKGVKFGRVRRLLALLDDDTDITDEAIDTVVDELVGNIISWNMEDELGGPVQVSRQALEDLEYPEVMEIVSKWLQEITGPNEELGKDSSSGVTFPVQLPTMEAL